MPSLGAFLAPDLLGGAKAFMIGSLIEEQFKGAAGNWPFDGGLDGLDDDRDGVARLCAELQAKGGK